MLGDSRVLRLHCRCSGGTTVSIDLCSKSDLSIPGGSVVLMLMHFAYPATVLGSAHLLLAQLVTVALHSMHSSVI
jgi:hypothetical protein